MLKKILPAALIATCSLGASAEYETMYLIKDNRVVGKYAVEDVDYASFTLPEGVHDENIWLTVNEAGKNKVSYTVSTVNPTLAYAHNIVSFPEVNYMALDFYKEEFEELSPEQQDYCLKLCLQASAYVGIGTDTYVQTDYQLDSTGAENRFSVTPGTRYFLCAWELDPVTYEPRENFTSTEFSTVVPAQSKAALDVAFKGQNAYGAAFTFAGPDIVYVRTVWGYKSQLDPYVDIYGLDLTLGTFGQWWSIDFLQGTNEEFGGIENATWQTPETGDYVLYVRGYDEAGDIVDRKIEVHATVETVSEGPEIKIYSKEKGNGSVSVNFEISPSNVEEAYVRLMPENTVDDRLNMGYELHELAMGGDAADIAAAINSTGEYTYVNNEVPMEWCSLLITALDKDGKRTTLRISFWPDAESEWSISNPVHKAPAGEMRKITRIQSRRNPSIAR